MRVLREQDAEGGFCAQPNGLPYRTRILSINHKKELRWSLWVIAMDYRPRASESDQELVMGPKEVEDLQPQAQNAGLNGTHKYRIMFDCLLSQSTA